MRQRVRRRIQQRDVWHDRYLSQGWKGIFDDQWRSTLSIEESSPDTDALVELAKVSSVKTSGEAFAERAQRLEENRPQPAWRTLEIPVDVPSRRVSLSNSILNPTANSMQTLTSVDLKCDNSQTTTGRFYEGRAIALSVQMRTTFAWAGEDWREAKMVYDIMPVMEDWLVLGKKKGFYTLSVSGSSITNSHNETRCQD